MTFTVNKVLKMSTKNIKTKFKIFNNKQKIMIIMKYKNILKYLINKGFLKY